MNGEEQRLFSGLLEDLLAEGPTMEEANRYYEGSFRLAALGMSIPPEMHLLQTVINWPRLVVTALEERLDIEGFRMNADPEPDDELWEWWVYNDLAEQSTLVHTEALVTGRGFVTIGYNDENPKVPRIVAESSRTMTVRTNPRTGEVIGAVRVYGQEEGDYAAPSRATLYLPDRTVHVRRDRGQWVSDPDIDDDEHNLGTVPVVPIVNRARIDGRFGRPLFEDITGLTDAACRSLTNLQAAQELMAVPQRVLFGMSADDFQDKDGNPVPKWEAYLGRLLTVPEAEGKAVEFSAASLNNFHSTINTYARHASALTGMPLRYLGVVSESNPTGADAIVADESRLIKSAERSSRGFSSGWAKVVRIARMMVYGEPSWSDTVEVLWRDPSTHTKAALADSAVKLYQASNASEGPLLPRSEVWKQLGYGPEQRRRLESQFADDPLSVALANMAPEAEVSSGSEPVANPTAAGRAGAESNSTTPVEPPARPPTG